MAYRRQRFNAAVFASHNRQSHMSRYVADSVYGGSAVLANAAMRTRHAYSHAHEQQN